MARELILMSVDRDRLVSLFVGTKCKYLVGRAADRDTAKRDGELVGREGRTIGTRSGVPGGGG